MNEFKIRKGLSINGSGSSQLEIQGSQGQLVTITDSLSGSIFSVNDISGIPIIEAFSDSTVKIGTFGKEAIKLSGSFATITGSLRGTASYTLFSPSASYTLSSSYSLTSSFVPTVVSASRATSASIALSRFPYTGNAIITGSLFVEGTTIISGSLGVTGSVGFAYVNTDGTKKQTFSYSQTTGDTSLSSSLNITGSINVLGSTINNFTSSFAVSASVANNVIPIFSKSVTIERNDFVQQTDVGTYPLWRVPFPLTASQILAYSTSSVALASGSRINANRNNLLLSATGLVLTGSMWVSSSVLQNQNFSIGDVLGINILALTGSLTEIIVQVDFIK